MNLEQEANDLASRFFSRFKDYKLGPEAVELITLPIEGGILGESRQHLRIYAADMGFGHFVKSDSSEQGYTINFKSLTDFRPTNQRFAEMVEMGDAIVTEMGLGARGREGLIMSKKIVRPGKVRGYHDVDDRIRENRAGLTAPEKITISYALVNLKTGAEERAKALWNVGIRPLLFVAHQAYLDQRRD